MKLQPKETEELELDMSPMIDMVFLLLIFFIIASQIIDEKPPVMIPTASYGKVPEDTTGRLMISVSAGPISEYFLGADPTPRTIEEVQDQIEIAINADPELRILIRSDAATKYKVNEKITLACAAVGAQDIIYSVFEE